MILVIHSTLIMHISSLILSFALADIGFALPTADNGLYDFLSKRATSPDNTCGDVYAGGNNSYSCDA